MTTTHAPANATATAVGMIASGILTWLDFGYLEATLGDHAGGDGCRFSITHHPTCHRRGPYRLLIEVRDWHGTWGCLDDQDQPMRWYHSREVAISEAEAIAAVLSTEHQLTIREGGAE